MKKKGRSAKQKTKSSNSHEGSNGKTAKRQIAMGRKKITTMHVTREEYNNGETEDQTTKVEVGRSVNNS